MTIEIPYLSHYAARGGAAARMYNSAKGGQRIAGAMFRNHPQSSYERPALRGIACQYGEVFERDGINFAFVKDCFAEALKGEISIRIDHTSGTDFGSTADGLRFVDCEDFLAFEYEIPKSFGGAVATSMVACGGRTDVSVGARRPKLVVKNLRGHDVNLIIEAGIEEISICTDGAVRRSHVRVIDLDEAQSLADEVKNGTLRIAATANEAATASKRLLASAEARAKRQAPKRSWQPWE